MLYHDLLDGDAGQVLGFAAFAVLFWFMRRWSLATKAGRTTEQVSAIYFWYDHIGILMDRKRSLKARDCAAHGAARCAEEQLERVRGTRR